MEDQSIFGSLCSNSASVRERHDASGERQVLFSFFFCFFFVFWSFGLLVFLFDDGCMSDELNMLNVIDYFLNASGHLYINDIQGYSIYRKLYHFLLTPPQHRVQK